MPRPRTKAQRNQQAAPGANGETTSGYFRRLFKENPKLLKGSDNSELFQRWLQDHPGHKEVPVNRVTRHRRSPFDQLGFWTTWTLPHAV
jgi:hypothetical protein